jgi:hypothetical protein
MNYSGLFWYCYFDLGYKVIDDNLMDLIILYELSQHSTQDLNNTGLGMVPKLKFYLVCS